MGLIVLTANGKGGVGKSVLACSSAVMCATAGIQTLIADINDEQHTSATWADTRRRNKIEPEIACEIMQPRAVSAAAQRCEMLIVDTPSWTHRNTCALAPLATFIIVPTGPNYSTDILPTIGLLQTLATVGQPAWKIGVVLNLFHTSARNEELIARHVLTEAGFPPLDGVIRNLPTFGTAYAEGRSLTETPLKNLNAEAERVLTGIVTGVNLAATRQANG